jgi:protein gp37
MGDLFHEDVTIEERVSVFNSMWNSSKDNIFILLTKRPISMALWFKDWGHEEWAEWPHLWLGVTAENQQRADERIPILLQIPAAVRLVSVEPMLGEVDLDQYLGKKRLWNTDQIAYAEFACQYPNCEIPALDWVIVGGETGPGARPMQSDWARSLREQCKAAKVPFFFKKHGDWWCKEFSKRPQWRENRQLDGHEWNEYPVEVANKC